MKRIRLIALSAALMLVGGCCATHQDTAANAETCVTCSWVERSVRRANTERRPSDPAGAQAWTNLYNPDPVRP